MVKEINNVLLIPQVLELAKNIPDTPLPVLEKMLIDALTSKKAKILVSENRQGELTGFMFASIEQMEGEDCVFIQTTYIKPDRDDKYTGWGLLNKMRLFGKDNNINLMYMMTPRNPKPFIRKYGFQFYTTVLRQKIIKEA